MGAMVILFMWKSSYKNVKLDKAAPYFHVCFEREGLSSVVAVLGVRHCGGKMFILKIKSFLFMLFIKTVTLQFILWLTWHTWGFLMSTEHIRYRRGNSAQSSEWRGHYSPIKRHVIICVDLHRVGCYGNHRSQTLVESTLIRLQMDIQHQVC